MKTKLKRHGPNRPPLYRAGNGSEGNAFVILGCATDAARKAGWSAKQVEAFLKDAKSGDYEHLLSVVAANFDHEAEE